MWSTTTSSSSAPVRAEVRSHGTSPPRASASCCSSAATGFHVRRRTGRRSPCSWTTATSHPTPGTTTRASRSSPGSTTTSAARRSSTALRSTGSRQEDFGELQHHDGVSPAWPISYDELEPYYTLAEQLYHVHGARGEDPTEPPASAPYPHPAVSHEPRIQQLADQLGRGRLPPVPCSVRDHARRVEHALQHVRALWHVRRFPCLVHAKSDAEVLGVRPALEHPNVTLLTNAKVVRLETNPGGTPSPRSSSIGTAPRSDSQATSWSSRAGPRTAPGSS